MKFEYIWLDGYMPEPNLRSKTRVILLESFDMDPDSLPVWGFDGSSTRQAKGNFSDCLLKPVRVVPDPSRKNAYLVMCEVMNPDGTPHPSNTRSKLVDNEDFWFGFEQEYTLMEGRLPVGFPADGYPAPQGMYYCSIGYGNVAGREVVEKHLDMCLKCGLEIVGINAEVMLGQWEFQLLGKGSRKASDDLWLARYLLARTAEEHKLHIELHPKPIKGDWNGSGMHTNFSNSEMRERGGRKFIEAICDAFAEVHHEHIAEYGSKNEERLTGMHETQAIDKFSYGVSDRGASIRIPISMVNNDWKGYLEDRRPASNADPYRVTARIIKTFESVKVEEVI